MTFEQKNDNVTMTLTNKVDDTATVYVRDDDLKWRRIQKPNDPRKNPARPIIKGFNPFGSGKVPLLAFHHDYQDDFFLPRGKPASKSK